MGLVQGIDPGYAIIPDCLTNRECNEIADALAGTMSRSRAGIRHLMVNPTVAVLARSEKLAELAQAWLGDEAIPFRATLFEKSGSINWLIPWHQDTALPLTTRFEKIGWGPWSEKTGAIYAHAPAWALARVIALRVHLDPSNSDNGPLRVIPGSHVNGVLSDRQIAEYSLAHGQIECLSPRGGVVAMRPLLIHASSKARSVEPRRVLHIEYADSLDFGGGIHLNVV